MPGRDEIAALIPHQGAMCLLDRIVEWDDRHVTVATASHRAPDNPLRSHGRLRAVHLCEYGAQAMAVHGGLVARTRGDHPGPGLLVSLREVQLCADFVDQLPGELHVSATRLLDTGRSWQYAFEARHQGRLLASGRAAIVARVI